MKGAIDVQDDYNSFIRRSINRAKCNYEDIFQNDAQEDSCGCGMIMGDAADSCSKAKNACGYGNIADRQSCHNEQTDMYKPECACKNIPVMVFIEMQPFGKMYNEAEGLCRGTLFPALDKPFTGRGGRC